MAETLDSASSLEPGIANGFEPCSGNRVEIDTSAPFESVREAAARFGGFGFWKPSHLHRISVASQGDIEEADIAQLEDQATELENELIVKECETLDVLKELEATNATVEELKSKLQQKEASEKEMAREAKDDKCGSGQPQPAYEILVELNQAKLNMCRMTDDLAGTHSSVEWLNKKLDEERIALEKTRERLVQTSLKEVQRLSHEAEEFERTGENSRSEVTRAMAKIQDMRNKIKTAEIRLVAARKMEEAARAAEAVALAEIKAVTGSKNTDEVTITVEEYTSLTQNAKDSEEKARKRVEDALSRVDEANVSKTEVLQKVEEAALEIKTSKRALEEALERMDAANTAKLEAEEAMRKWRWENGQRRRSSSASNTVKFKNPCPPQHREETQLMDMNGLNLTNEGSLPTVQALKPTMSIGQILSRKLILAEEPEMNVLGEKGRWKVSLGQMLGKTNNNGDGSVSKKSLGKENGKRLTGKRRKFGLAKLSVLLNKESKMTMKKKIASLNLR
ncbi:PREDICTED: WEB family protein At2g38370 isoform X2 [Tarenaya hassleriana]|uniref:WEB family protein At2g38370 isoform X2 n=1 Tax=Tarenaya hassleriana TaxID=28532 RepID=UPI00053C9EC4|nr:PREDICTED: WEB family protein At2g38370 isoform X2 [Tarenaya hassleriana]